MMTVTSLREVPSQLKDDDDAYGGWSVCGRVRARQNCLPKWMASSPRSITALFSVVGALSDKTLAEPSAVSAAEVGR